MSGNYDEELRIKLEKVRELEGQAKDHCAELYQRPGHYRRMEIINILLRKLVSGMNFIDIGCAEGLYCKIAYEFGARRVLGIDISPTKIARAKERYPKCEFICRDIFKLSEFKNQFDVAFCSEVLQHVPDYILASKSVLNCLRPGGYAIFTAPNLSERTDHIKATIFPEMTTEELLVEIGGAGFGKQNALWKFNTDKLFREIIEYGGITLVDKIPVDTPDGERQNLWTVGVFQIDN